MPVLVVRHVNGSTPPKFLVHLQGHKILGPVEVTPAAGYPVLGGETRTLLPELRWYQEEFLKRPYHPDTLRAERLQATLAAWGREIFEQLFGDRARGKLFDTAFADPAALRLQIASDDPRILAWPWEALRHEQRGALGLICQLERRVEELEDPPPLPELPRDRVRILMVTARPYEADVAFRTISRPLVEWVDEQKQ